LFQRLFDCIRRSDLGNFVKIETKLKVAIKGVVDEESFFVLRKTVLSASSFIARVDAVAPQRDHDPRKHAGESASEAAALPSHCRAEQLVGLDPLSNRGDVGSL
jgi:hypothetical protein